MHFSYRHRRSKYDIIDRDDAETNIGNLFRSDRNFRESRFREELQIDLNDPRFVFFYQQTTITSRGLEIFRKAKERIDFRARQQTFLHSIGGPQSIDFIERQPTIFDFADYAHAILDYTSGNCGSNGIINRYIENKP